MSDVTELTLTIKVRVRGFPASPQEVARDLAKSLVKDGWSGKAFQILTQERDEIARVDDAIDTLGLNGL